VRDMLLLLLDNRLGVKGGRLLLLLVGVGDDDWVGVGVHDRVLLVLHVLLLLWVPYHLLGILLVLLLLLIHLLLLLLLLLGIEPEALIVTRLGRLGPELLHR
jgi:hypothetical protein